MNGDAFAARAQLGMRAVARPPWREPLDGRIVGLTAPRYGVWIKDSRRGVVEYVDCVWVVRIDEAGPPVGATAAQFADIVKRHGTRA